MPPGRLALHQSTAADEHLERVTTPATVVPGSKPTSSTSVRSPRWQAAPRRFSDEALAGLTQQVSSIACECPRHLAEIVLQLAHFERYSADCLAGSPADTALHLHLSGLAAAARTQFEQALARVVAAEGLDVTGPRGALMPA